MAKLIDEFYDNYRDQTVTFNQKVIDELGLITDKISVKCGNSSYSCILYSSSMAEARVIAHLNKEFFIQLKEQGKKVSIRYVFNIPGKRSDMSFFIKSKLTSFSEYSPDKPNLYFLNVEFLNKPPNDLIEILGSHIKQISATQKRMEQRIDLKDSNNDTTGIKMMENYLFISGNGKKCLLTEISIFSAKVVISGKESDFKPGSQAMLIMKAKGLEGVGEMMGYIERVDLINRDDNIYSLIINFDQDKIPPTYKLWIAECIELIKINH